MGLVTSIRPVSTHCWSLSRLTFAMSGARLPSSQHGTPRKPNWIRGTRSGDDVLVDEALLAPDLHEGGLASLEPRFDLSMLLLALVASSGRLTVPRRRAPSYANAFLVGAGVVTKVAEDRGAPRLDRERCKQRRQLRRIQVKPCCASTALGRWTERYSWRHRRCVWQWESGVPNRAEAQRFSRADPAKEQGSTSLCLRQKGSSQIGNFFALTPIRARDTGPIAGIHTYINCVYIVHHL